MVESGNYHPVFPELTMKDIILEWYQELLREHGESRWPEFAWPGPLRWYMPTTKLCYRYFPDASYRYSVTLLPVFAAVASGKTTFGVFLRSPAPHFLRQV